MTLRVMESAAIKRRSTIEQQRMRQHAVELFEQFESTTHSALAETLPFIIQHCEDGRIPYELKALPGIGYVIRKIKPGEI